MLGLCLSLPLLASCSGDVKEQLGLRRDAPDEFAVQRKPKLEIPPEFKVRPPQPGAEALYATEAREELKSSLIGDPVYSDASEGESALLQKMKVQSANPEIRSVLRSEYGDSDPDLLDRIRSISDDNNNKTLVDAEAERERISENKKEGKPVAEGEIPTKSRSEGKSVIDKILGE